MNQVFGRACTAVVMSLASATQAQTFDSFRATPPGVRTTASGVSADGTVVSGLDGARGFVWRRETGMQRFGDEAGVPGYTEPLGISGDGTCAVGSGGSSETGFIAYRWRGTGTYEALGVQRGYTNSYARDANVDGSVVVGRSQDSLGFVGQAFRWTEEEGVQGLGFLSGADRYSEAMAVSADGNVAVGYSDGFTMKAFTWSTSQGMQELVGLPGSNLNRALGCNSDARWVVGDSFGRGALWHDGVFQSLGLFGNFGTRATGVTDDGQLVAGAIRNFTLGFDTAALWTSSGGWIPLSDYLAANGVVLPTGVILREITGMSADGRTIVGQARTLDGVHFGFVTTIPSPGALSIFVLAILGRSRREFCS